MNILPLGLLYMLNLHTKRKIYALALVPTSVIYAAKR